MLSRFGSLFCCLINCGSRYNNFLRFSVVVVSRRRVCSMEQQPDEPVLIFFTHQEWEDLSNMFVYIAYFVAILLMGLFSTIAQSPSMRKPCVDLLCALLTRRLSPVF